VPGGAAIDEDGWGSSMLLHVLIADCGGGFGCLCENCGRPRHLRQCVFVDNAVGAIAHASYEAAQDVMESCCFVNTSLRGTAFWAGSVVIDRCLFAGEVQSTASIVPTGVQVGFTSTETSFDTASLLPTCGGVGLPPTPRETGPTETSEETSKERTTEALPTTPNHSTVSLPPRGRNGQIVQFVVVNNGLVALGFLI
jgi:hypothetical protein